MGMFEDIQRQFMDARKSQDKFLSNALSMIISDLKYEKINKQKDLDDGDVTAYLQKSIKQKKEVLAEFEKAGRTDLIDKEKKEIEIISGMLPAMMPEEELRQIALSVKQETGASGPSDIGKVMKEVMAKVRGRADGAQVKNIVNEVLKNG